MGIPDVVGVYVVTCGDCLAHVGTSGHLRSRLHTLAALGTHRGSAEVLCAAFCANQPPLVWWEPSVSVGAARIREAEFKKHYGEPPVPRPKYESCRNGVHLKRALIAAAGEGTWAAGFIEAVFAIGENLRLLFNDRRLDPIWARAGVPPGPWRRDASS